MVKKVVLGSLLLGLIGILLAGAVVRTLDRTGNVAEARGEGGPWAESSDYGCEEAETGAAVGAGAGQGGSQGGGRYGGQGQGSLSGDEAGTGQAQVDEWLALEGTLQGVDDATLAVQTADGQEVLIEGRPLRFLQEQGFAAQPGDQVRLAGFYENGEFEVGQVTNLRSGQTVQIRDANGRPLWAGRGRSG